VRKLQVSTFAHTRDASPAVRVVDFPDAFDDFREADARVLRDFLDYDFHKNKPPTPTAHPGKNGPLWSPALFNGARSKPNVVSVCALVLDYDGCAGRNLDADEVVARWEKYEHVLHSTYTPGRWRVILPYKTPITPAQHDAVFAWVLRREGDAIDAGCRDASRMFYWPTCRTDLDVEPVFGYTRGELLDPGLLGPDLPSRASPARPGTPSSSPIQSPSRLHPAASNRPPGATGGGAAVSKPPPDAADRTGPKYTAPRENPLGGGADSIYAGIESVDQREDLPLIESRCAFMAHVRADMARQDHARVTEPQWYAGLSIIARCRGGDDLAHEVSSPYPGYDPDACEEKYQRAKGVGPATCAHIRGISTACRACPLQITSPVLLGRTAAAPPSPSALDVSERASVAGGDAPDLLAAIVEAEARQQQARAAEDAALLAVEAARRRLTTLRSARSSGSEDDVAEAVKALGDARETHRQATRIRTARERDTAAARKRTSVDGLPPGADPAVWQRLRMGRDGAPLNVTSNMLHVLDGDPRWRSRLSFDDFATEVCLDGAPLPEEEATRLVGKLGDDYHIDASTNTLLECVRTVAITKKFHPIQNWLDGLRWDGTKRVDDLMLRGFGALPRHDEELVRLLGARFIVSLVARAKKAGAQVDTMLVLTGKQGKFKSSSFRTLVGDPWFADTKMDLANKDSFISLRGKWLIEFGEMAAVRRADDNTGKGWLTSRVDNYREPYGRRNKDHPRTAVTCGSANGEDYEFLQDPTGWRRYWPVTVSKADLGWIADNREMLFAEAVVMHGAGFRWWFDEDTDESARLQKFVAPFVPTHPWTEEVARWLAATVNDRTLELVSIVTVLNRALGKPIGDVTKKDETDMGNILRNIGCERVDRDFENGIYTTRYRRPARMSERAKGGVVNISSRGHAPA
jgi:predicted P-loop ATPase